MKTWKQQNFRLDPWSYRNLLAKQKEIGAPNISVAMRYVLRRVRVKKSPKQEEEEFEPVSQE